MSDRRRLFFIGWNYQTPASNTLKRALMDPGFPWEIGAIVHDTIWVAGVDDIALMTTEQFLQRTDLADVDVLVSVVNPSQRALWARRLRDLGVREVDEGELLRTYSAELGRRGERRSLGATQLPQGLSDEAVPGLLAWQGRWPDAASNRAFNGYLGFLQSGLLAMLAEVDTGRAGEHPYFSPKDTHVEQFKRAGTGLIWEIAETRSAFIEQGVILHNIGDYTYAFSAFDRRNAEAEGHRLAMLFKPFALTPALSHLSFDGQELVQRAVGSAPTPEASQAVKHVHLDVAEPFAVLQWLDENTSSLLARVRIPTPGDLLRCLQHFPIERLSLSLDRAGSKGLVLVYCKLAPTESDAAA